MKNRSNWYTGTLFGALSLTAISLYSSALLGNGSASFTIHVITSIILYITSLTSLSFTAAESGRLKQKLRQHSGKLRPFQFFPLSTATFVTRATGLLAGAYVAALPLALPARQDHPLADVCLRVPTFFYGCKLLDLAAARAHRPPVPRAAKDDALYGLRGPRARAAYGWRLLAETRYASFDIATDGSRRDGLSTSAARGYGLPLVLFTVTFFFPVAELVVLSGVLCIQLGLEGLHTLLHPRCPNWLFWQPFASRGFSDFWACRWQQAARPWLYNLGYVPARSVFTRLFGKGVGRAAGVLGTFSLSGIWHAWAGAALTRDEYVWPVSIGMWGLFVLQGVGCLVERLVLRNEEWRTGWRRNLFTVICWACDVEAASIWLRYALPRSNVLAGLAI